MEEGCINDFKANNLECSKLLIKNNTTDLLSTRNDSKLGLGTDIIPDADITYSLGTADRRFKELHLSPGTLHLGDQTMKSSSDGIELDKIVLEELSLTKNNFKQKFVPHNSLGVNHTFTMPQSLPSATRFLKCDTSGNFTFDNIDYNNGPGTLTSIFTSDTLVKEFAIGLNFNEDFVSKISTGYSDDRVDVSLNKNLMLGETEANTLFVNSTTFFDAPVNFNQNNPVITLSGDVSGTATMNNLKDVTINTTIQNNSVALGTDTTGNYIATIVGTSNEINVSNSGSENANVTLSLPTTTSISSGKTLDVSSGTFTTSTAQQQTIVSSTNVINAGGVMRTGNQTIGGSKTFSNTIIGDINGNSATVTNGVYTTSSATALSDITSAGSGSIITDDERTKLNEIEASATADQTENEIKVAYENNSNTNCLTDALLTKLSGIETSADVTDTANVTSAGAVMKSTIDSKGDILVGTANDTITRLPVGTNNFVLSADSSTATGLKWKAASGGGGGGGSSTFEGLADTESFSGNSGKILKLNTAENLLEFVDESSGGGGSGITNNRIDGDLTIGDDNTDSFVVNSNSLFTGTFKATGDGDIKEINDYMDLDFGLLTTSRPPQNKTGIYIPYYQYPNWTPNSTFLENGFKNLMNILDRNTDVPVLAIINPNSGPGDSYDANYGRFIKRLNNHNITIIGYLATTQGDKTVAAVNEELLRWFEFYPEIKGIFFDEVPAFDNSNKAQHIAYYNQLYRMVKSESRRVLKRFLTVTINTGVTNEILYPLSIYEHSGDITNVCFDQILDHENSIYPNIYGIETADDSDLASIRHFNRGARIAIVHSQNTYNETMVKKMMKYWSWIFITKDVMDNPFDDFTIAYIEEMCKTFSDNSKFDDKLDKVGNISIGEDNSDLLTINSTINIPGGTTGQSLVKGADGNITYSTVSGGGGGSDITIQNNGNGLTTAATTLNFTTGITASGSGSTINIAKDSTILDGATITTNELNVLDGNTSATSTTIADADRVVLNDDGTMKQVAVTDLAAYFDDEITAMPNLTSVGTLSSLTVSGNLVADGSTFKIDSVNNRVGIGTATPIRPLHIKSEGAVFAIEGNTHSYIEFYPDSYSSGRKGYFGYPGDTNDGLYFINQNNANIVFGTNSAERLIINGSGDTTLNGSSASSQSDERPRKLEFNLPYTAGVKERCYGSLIFKDILTGSSNAKPSLSVQLVAVNNPSFTNTPLTIVSHSDTDGRVGIGTTSPSTPLHVNGNITCTTLVGNCSGTSTSVNLTQDTSTDSNFIIPFTNGTSGSRQLKGSSSLTFNPSTGILNGSMIFSVIDNSSNRIINPSQLSVGKVKFNFANFNNDNNSPFADAIHFNTYTDSSGGKQNLLMLKKTGIGMRIYQNHNDFDTNSAYSTYKDVVLADSNGNVGIGITSPSTPLHVNGNITCTTLVGNCSGTSTSVNITEDTSSNSKLLIPFTNSTSSTTGSRQLKSNSNLNINPSTLTLETPKNITIKGSSASSQSDERPTTLKFDLPYTEGVKNASSATLVLKDILTASSSARPSLGVEFYESYPPYTETHFTIVSHSSTDGRVGIGTTNPESQLHIEQANLPADGSSPYTNVSQGGQGIRISNSSNYWGIYISNNKHLRFNYSGDLKGYVDQNDNNAQMNFTGQHRSILNKNIDENSVGLIVSSNGKYININNSLNTNINESLPICSITSIDNDTKVFGVISDKEDTNSNRDYSSGNFVSSYEKTNKNEQRMYINSLGEGAIWVCNKNDVLVNGDYISSSSVVGYGQKQILEEGTLKNFTVAKITCDCDFSLNKIVKQKLKVITTIETYEVNVTEDVEKTNTETKIKYDETLQKYVEETINTTTTEKENLYDIVNVYDSSGDVLLDSEGNARTYQIERKETKTKIITNIDYNANGDVQYEDDLDADGNQQMIYPFETRFLRADATEITEEEYNTKLEADESVYIACFVGCTYHCG